MIFIYHNIGSDRPDSFSVGSTDPYDEIDFRHDEEHPDANLVIRNVRGAVASSGTDDEEDEIPDETGKKADRSNVLTEEIIPRNCDYAKLRQLVIPVVIKSSPDGNEKKEDAFSVPKDGSCLAVGKEKTPEENPDTDTSPGVDGDIKSIPDSAGDRNGEGGGSDVSGVDTDSKDGQSAKPVHADEGSGLLTGDFIQERKNGNDGNMSMGFIKPFENRAEMDMINKLRELYAANNKEGVDRLLDRWRILAKYRYDEIHRSGLHNFSRPKERPPFMKFAEYFGRRTNMDDKSIIGELGCGFGAVADYFARDFGAKVYAIDVSEYAINSAINEIQDKPYKDRVVFSIEDFQEALSTSKIPVTELQFPGFGDQRVELPKFTHMFSQSSFHYDTPWNLVKLLNTSYDSLEPGGYFGLAIKTNRSDSATSEKHNIIYKGDDMSVFVDKTDKMLRIYIDEKKIVEIIQRSTKFSLLDMGIQVVQGYDLDNDNEEFRNLILKRGI